MNDIINHLKAIKDQNQEARDLLKNALNQIPGKTPVSDPLLKDLLNLNNVLARQKMNNDRVLEEENITEISRNFNPN